MGSVRIERLVLLGSILLGAGALTPSGAEELPEFARRDTLRAAVSEFQAIGDASRYHDLAGALGELVLEQVLEIEERTRSEAELAAYRAELQRDALSDARATVRRRRRERDEAFFDAGGREQRRDRAETAAERLAEAKRRLETLEALSAEKIAVEAQKPIEWAREFAPGIDRDPQRTLTRENLDLVIGGVIEPLDRYLFLRIEGHARGVAEPVFASEFVALPEELYPELEAETDHVLTQVLGRDWAAVAVETGDSEARIVIDGRTAGYGDLHERFLRPGSYRVEAVDRAGRRRSEVVTLEAGERRDLSLVVGPSPRTTAQLRTEPAEANLYLQSRRLGRTPLELELPERDQLALIRRDGYLDSRMVLGPRTEAEFERSLQPDTEDQSARLLDRRNRFYRAFGYFVLSVPVTLVLNGVYENLSSAVPRDGAPIAGLSSSEQDRIASQREVAYWGAVGAFGVSAGLFVNMGVRLYQYIRTGEEAHYR